MLQKIKNFKYYKNLIFKLMIFVIIGNLIGVGTIAVFGFQYAKKELINAGKRDLMHITENAVSLMETLNEQVKKKSLTLEEAQEIARIKIVGPMTNNEKKLRDYTKSSYLYKNEGYIFAYTSDYTNVMHPVGVEGKNLKDKKDASGDYVIRTLVEKSKKEKIEDKYHAYMWLNVNETTPREKLAYVTYFQEWDWMIGVGAYTYELYEELGALKNKIILISSIVMIISSLTFYFLIRKRLKIINDIKNNILEISNGNLKVNKIVDKGNDEIKILADSSNDMINNLKGLIEHINMSSTIVTDSSNHLHQNTNNTLKSFEQLNETIQKVKEGAIDSSTTLNESLTSVNEMTEGMLKISNTSSIVSEYSTKTVDSANDGNKIIKDVIEQMNSISNLNQNLSILIDTLNKRSSEIENISQIITDIAGETNLLSLNASIEAARAGEHGRGFAVVANEVKKLSDESKNSASQISEITKLIATDIANTNKMMQISLSEINKGTTLVDKAGNAFKVILEQTQQVSNELMELAAVTQQVSAGAEQVNALLDQVNENTKNTSSNTSDLLNKIRTELDSMKNIQNSANDLNKLSNDLQDSIKKFSI